MLVVVLRAETCCRQHGCGTATVAISLSSISDTSVQHSGMSEEVLQHACLDQRRTFHTFGRIWTAEAFATSLHTTVAYANMERSHALPVWSTVRVTVGPSTMSDATARRIEQKVSVTYFRPSACLSEGGMLLSVEACTIQRRRVCMACVS